MASGTWNTGSWGQNQWGDNANPTVIPTGFGMSAALGDESSTTEINLGWGRQEWGLQGWGIAGTLIPTGNSLSANLGTLGMQGDVTIIPTGLALTNTLNSVVATGRAEVDVTGFALTNSLGTADAGPDAMLTGIGATMGLGAVEAFNNEGWGRLGWGINDWGDAGSSVQVDVTGIAMTSALGSSTEVSGDATIVANTLNVAQLTLGVVDPAPDAMIIGEPMIASLGTLGMQGDVSPSVTGIAMTAALGNETVDLNTPVNVTGIGMLSRVASATAFTDVTATFTGFGLTMNLNNANALIWNEVPTGNAPIDPPGWLEVVA